MYGHLHERDITRIYPPPDATPLLRTLGVGYRKGAMPYKGGVLFPEFVTCMKEAAQYLTLKQPLQRPDQHFFVLLVKQVTGILQYLTYYTNR